MNPLRLVFMGTAHLACSSLQALTQQPEIKVLAVVTQPDRPKGRDLKLQPSPVKSCAQQLGLSVLQPERARHEAFIHELKQLNPDLIVVAAYGQILPPAILDLPCFGCLNVHTSLLPKYRGAAPIQWAILNDEAETGVTIMKMDPGMDTGDILSQTVTPISSVDNAQTVHDRLALLGAELLVETIPVYLKGGIVPRPQPREGATYARKISKQDGHLDWRQPARVLWNRVRALTPWPGAFSYQAQQPPEKARLLKIWETALAEQGLGNPGQILAADKHGIVVSCATDALRILQLQPEGGRRMSAQEFLAGHPLIIGEHLV